MFVTTVIGKLEKQVFGTVQKTDAHIILAQLKPFFRGFGIIF